MPSKKKPAEKRASLPLSCDYTKQFIKDWTRLSRSDRYDMKQLKKVMMLLVANEATLGPEWKDHALAGRWSGTRECHVGGDILLIYEIDDSSVVLTRTGTHSELF